MANIAGAIDITSSGDSTVIAGVAGQTITIYGMFFQCGAATTITLKDASTHLTGPMSFVAGGGMSVFFGAPIFTLGTGDSFIINVSGLLPQVGGFVYYTQG